MPKYTVIAVVDSEDDNLTPDGVRQALYDAGDGTPFSFDITSVTEDDAALRRAREQAVKDLAKLLPGNLGINLATEIADKIMAAARAETETG